MSADATAEVELQSVRSQAPADADTPSSSSSVALDKQALFSLLAQHLSSTWQQRSFEFGAYLFLVNLFPDTTLQPSIFGFFTTGAAILLSGSVGSLVDHYARIPFVRATVVVQKGTLACSYAVFLACFLRLHTAAQEGREQPILTGLFVIVVLFSMLQNLATIGMSVAVERDWVTCIAQGDGARLTTLNTWLRRIDLLSKLLAPLFVSLLTTAASYTLAAAFLLGLSVGSLTFEFFWIHIVYKRFPMLSTAQLGVRVPAETSATEAHPTTQSDRPAGPVPRRTRLAQLPARIRLRIFTESRNWLEFIRAPVFFSSLAISLLYMTVLSFEGSMLAYLKSHDYDDSFVAGMRGVGVVTGLLGTLLMPFLEPRIGLVRTGTWSILSEVITLVPALLAFFVGAPPDGERAPAYNDVLLFSGMALSRVGLWSFDLAQLKELQQALDEHPRRNAIMALQFALQNIFDLIKYVVTIILNRPSQFKWAVAISFGAVCCGAASYLVYARKERGHLVHTGWMEPLLRKGR
ncbi:uncharacterized protein JCM10292_004052 [Rhodotorula paludigena]|uniref:uncharacterized protein n=1 Tax=Rhodotorula paludigena TaxID=86838 RepID=UPI00318127B2